MTLPFYKIISLCIRVFSRPVVTYIKNTQLQKDSITSGVLKNGFVKMGNTYNFLENWVNRKFMNIDSKFALKPLNENIAAEKGVEFLFELLFYSLVIGVPLYEINKMYNDAEAKADAINCKLKDISDNLEVIIKQKEEKIATLNRKIIQPNIVVNSKEFQELLISGALNDREAQNMDSLASDLSTTNESNSKEN